MIKNHSKIKKAWDWTKITGATVLAGLTAKEFVLPNKLFSRDVEKQFVGRVVDKSSGLSLADVIVKINSNDQTVQDTTDDNGKYDASITYTGINDPDNSQPKEFELIKQNYPNPFNPGTTIPVFGNGDLTIYNTLGQIVFSNHISNDNTIILKGLASGLYFAKYNNHIKSDMKKMVLLDGGDVKITVDHSIKASLASIIKTASFEDDLGDTTRYELSKDGFFDLDTTLLTFEGINEHNFTLTPLPVLNWYVLESNVKDKDNQNSLPNVNINYQPTGFDAQDKTTNSNGIATTDTIRTTNKTLEIITIASLEGYENKIDALTLTPGTTNQEIALEKVPLTIYNYIIKGKITDQETSQGLENVLVTIANSNEVDSVYSDVNGFYTSDTIKTESESIDVGINTFKDGYEDFAKNLLGITPGVTEENVSMVPFNKVRIYGTVTEETGDFLLTQGTINIQTSDAVVHQIIINQNGTYDSQIIGYPDDEPAKVFLSNNPDYTTNTFTMCKKGVVTAVGVTGSSVGVFEPDTLSTTLEKLGYKDGHYFLAFSDSSASNELITDMIRDPATNYGVFQWTPENKTFVNMLISYEGTTTSPEKVQEQKDAISFFMDKYTTAQGLTFVNVDSTSSNTWTYDPTAKSVVHQQDGQAGNSRHYTSQTTYDYTTAHTDPDWGGVDLMISEIAEAEGINDGSSGSNNLAFKTVDGQIQGFNHTGEVVWSAAKTYMPGSFKKPVN